MSDEPDDERPDDELPTPFRHVPAEVVAGGIAELAAYVLGADWTSSLLAPALTAVARAIWQADRRQWQQAAAAAQIAVDELGGEDVVTDRALADPARTELFRRVIEAAGRSTLPEKIPALGRVLANGLPDGDQIDEALFLAAALHDLQAPHVQVLGLLRDRAAGPSIPDYAGNPVGWFEHEIAEIIPGYRSVLPTVLRTIEIHGLTYQTSGVTANPATPGSWSYIEGDIRIAVSNLGRRCLDLLDEQHPEPPA